MAGPGAPLDREQAQLVVLVLAVLMLFSSEGLALLRYLTGKSK